MWCTLPCRLRTSSTWFLSNTSFQRTRSALDLHRITRHLSVWGKRREKSTSRRHTKAHCEDNKKCIWFHNKSVWERDSHYTHAGTWHGVEQFFMNCTIFSREHAAKLQRKPTTGKNHFASFILDSVNVCWCHLLNYVIPRPFMLLLRSLLIWMQYFSSHLGLGFGIVQDPTAGNIFVTCLEYCTSSYGEEIRSARTKDFAQGHSPNICLNVKMWCLKCGVSRSIRRNAVSISFHLE